MKRFAWVLLAVAIPSCGGKHGGGGGSAPIPLSTQYDIDGLVDFAGLTTTTATIAFYDGLGAFVKNTTITYAMTNDDQDIYMAFQWTDDTFNNGYTWAGPTDFDGLQLLLDNNGNGTYDANEDTKFVITATPIGSQYLDHHNNMAGEDLCGDGVSKLRYEAAAQRYQAEFLFPLAADAQGEDATITALTRFNVLLHDNNTGAAANSALLFPSVSVTGAWGAVPYAAVAPIPRPAIPAGLTGLVIFTSTHEDAKGEIYTFNPATGVVMRITTNSIFEDIISLSHDRLKIAFTGAPTQTDYSNYEIYTINVDGTAQAQLTSNAIIDGHPAWSPDDSKIAYASFRDAGTASIIVMTSAGVELADLTTAPDDDNDPEFLPDGRIVFKTNRFNSLPQVKIATMNDDGTGVQQVTFTADSPNTSDHDPVGDATYALFERFTKGTDYSTDIESIFSPWNLIEARLDGTGERVVLADGWVNWLPVYDPTGQVIVHLKSTGYTEIRLITRAGLDLGRLVPNITKVRYLDWK